MLNSSIRIGSFTLKNRIALPPMATFGMGNPDDSVSESQLSHYAAYAENGNGLVIVEASAVSKMNEPRTTIGLYDDCFIPGLTKLAKAVKQNGAVGIIQLINTGLSIMEENSISEISREKFIKYKNDFVSAAIRCKAAGFDGIELHAAHGFYLDTVIETSDRADEYGGNLENRMRCVREIIKDIRANCGKDFVIGVRLGASTDISETIAMAKCFEADGADYIHVSFGVNRDITVPEDFRFDKRIYAAKCVIEAISVPVICVGGIKKPEQAEEVLENGYADICAVGTAQLADKHWAEKALRGEAPAPCLGCKECLWWTDGRKCPLNK